MSYEFKSTSSRISQSMKTQVNSLRISVLPKIISPKLIGIREETRTFSFYSMATASAES